MLVLPVCEVLVLVGSSLSLSLSLSGVLPVIVLVCYEIPVIAELNIDKAAERPDDLDRTFRL